MFDIFHFVNNRLKIRKCIAILKQQQKSILVSINQIKKCKNTEQYKKKEYGRVLKEKRVIRDWKKKTNFGGR